MSFYDGSLYCVNGKYEFDCDALLCMLNRLARRLLNQRSASDELEQLMIVKLKQKFGAVFTVKMEGMLIDLSVGADVSNEFNKIFEAKTRLCLVANVYG